MNTTTKCRLGRAVAWSLLTGCLVSVAGCSRTPENQAAEPPLAGSSVDPSQASTGSLSALTRLSDLVVSSTDGEATELSQYLDQQTLVLVFSRGYFGSICPFCSTQMHALAEAYSEFEKRNARVVVVFPVSQDSDKGRWKDLEASILERMPGGLAVPFPIMIDLNLKAVDQLGIREALSKPSTFIIDQSNNLRYQYIGSDPADRPSVETILQQLDGL